MENRLEVQKIQGDELFMDLTPEELKELEQFKGGLSFPKSNEPLPNGIPTFPIRDIKELTAPADLPITDWYETLMQLAKTSEVGENSTTVSTVQENAIV
ncbi:hypothetical protein NIES4072_50970 [Nostoc commune NIES-4072]|uniref:Uncharacterized protein n=1 Tax=Nostoc commune NIES-4072 TaxID=2005467 RepID=A0A2R5FYU2_NOSCO|nr:hypothetical protein [Nostoc commune]BBD67605.1 hypothetical protein NIES4070_39980 [Nostoc commune HK-02]GBG21413.1 hypothetical protein NIES4072_50970 [Nostoc commune NIES-4072]